MRLIDADALKQALFDEIEAQEPIVAIIEYIFKLRIDNAPTIDAVPVVRCKDCMFYTEMDYEERARYCPDPGGRYMLLDGFCACGERKNND